MGVGGWGGRWTEHDQRESPSVDFLSFLQLLFVSLQLRHEAGVWIDHMTSCLHFLGMTVLVLLIKKKREKII